MKHVWMAGLALISAIAVSGCVSDKKYQAVLADADAARSDLERTRAQKNALEQQVKPERSQREIWVGKPNRPG